MNVLKLGERITILPVIHGSGDFALAVRRIMLDTKFDCVAVPLPQSFQSDVEKAIDWLPMPTVVCEQPPVTYGSDWTPESEQDDQADESPQRQTSFVPVDPCQPVIAAIRGAMGERIPRAFVDLETEEFLPYAGTLPDPYALKEVSVEQFSAAVLPSIPPLPHDQARARVAYMANRLKELAVDYSSILMVCSIVDWPWLRDAFNSRVPSPAIEAAPAETQIYEPELNTILFMLGELPFITGLYERARQELEDDENLSIDGIKELLITARNAYRQDFKNRSRKITPHTLSTILKYVRNLTLMDRRLTPDLFNLVIGAKQVAGDSYALHVAEQAREYPFVRETPFEAVTLGVDRIRLPNGEMYGAVNRLPGHPIVWRSCQLQPRPSKRDKQDWEMQWNPFSQCSWPPEDEKIEDFRTHVADKAKAIMGMDLARTEKFTTSIQDGLDIRETLRNWHTGDLYVKVMPPTKGRLDSVVMLFDSPADPRDYPWRSTWFAEHQNESTLAFFATDFREEMVGPGIAQGVYGGAMFLFPPVHIRDIWIDPALDFTSTMEERMIAAACMHAECPHVALLSSAPPGAGWRRLAKRFKKKLVHVPLSSFSQSTVQQLRIVHVLNGHHIRSFAADFIRKA
ncbi:MAG: hypothetical protein AAF497_02450 [Planctomycetota bacterium]